MLVVTLALILPVAASAQGTEPLPPPEAAERDAPAMPDGVLPEDWDDLFPDSARRELDDFFGALRDGLGALAGEIGDLSDYEVPEILPNGDILIRRKTPLPPAPIEPEIVGPQDPVDI